MYTFRLIFKTQNVHDIYLFSFAKIDFNQTINQSINHLLIVKNDKLLILA